LPKVELGTKHTCESCGAKFYDMKKMPPTCPSCGTVVELEAKRKARGTRPEEAKRKPVVVKDAELDEDDEEVEDIDDDDADALLEDEEDDADDDIGVGVGDDEEED
jgi:predicted  nucleic acid-binding Zn-ribbon protein